ncbi:MAG: hypothetical protein ACN4GT_04800 [Gammaproteobacteria bacterium]
MTNDNGYCRKPRSRAGASRAALVALALTLLIVSTPAWAYLDPGTGSMIISAIVGLFATVGLAVKTYWYKIKAMFRRDAPVAESSTEPAVDSTLDSTMERDVAEAERSTES